MSDDTHSRGQYAFRQRHKSHIPESQLSLYFVLVVFILIADICSYTFLVDVSNRRHIISPVFHEIGQAYFWRYYYTHTHMVKADISLYQDRSFHLTQIPQYFPIVTLICHIHRFPSVLRDKHDLIGVIPLHMLYISIVHLIFILFLFVAATPLHFIIRIFTLHKTSDLHESLSQMKDFF